MTLGSTTKEGSWELLPTGQLLIARGTNDLVKLENMFVEQALLVLKRSATDDPPLVLINQQLIPDLDAVKYLEKYEHEKSVINTPQSEQKYILLNTGEIIASDLYIGKQINTLDGIKLFGVYKVAYDTTGKHILIINNSVRKIFYRVKYWYNSVEFFLEQDDLYVPKINNIIFEGDQFKIPVNKSIEISDKIQRKYLITVDNEYRINKIIDHVYSAWMIIIISLILVVLIALIISVSRS